MGTTDSMMTAPHDSARPSRLRQLLGVGSLGLFTQRSSTSAASSWLGPLHSERSLQLSNGMLRPSAHSFSRGGGGAPPLILEGSGEGSSISGGGPGLQQAGGEHVAGDAVSNSASCSGSLPVIAVHRDDTRSGCSSLGDGAPFSGQLPAPAGSTDTGASGRMSRGAISARRRFWNLLMRPGAGGTHESLFKGLRVRMGVASGVLTAGIDIHSSSVFDVAKGGSARRYGAGVGETRAF